MAIDTITTITAAPQLRSSDELSEFIMPMLEKFQKLPIELAAQLRTDLIEWQPNSSAIQKAFEEVLDRRSKAVREGEGEQDSVAKVTYPAVVRR